MLYSRNIVCSLVALIVLSFFGPGDCSADVYGGEAEGPKEVACPLTHPLAAQPNFETRDFVLLDERRSTNWQPAICDQFETEIISANGDKRYLYNHQLRCPEYQWAFTFYYTTNPAIKECPDGFSAFGNSNLVAPIQRTIAYATFEITEEGMCPDRQQDIEYSCWKASETGAREFAKTFMQTLPTVIQMPYACCSKQRIGPAIPTEVAIIPES